MWINTDNQDRMADNKIPKQFCCVNQKDET